MGLCHPGSASSLQRGHGFSPATARPKLRQVKSPFTEVRAGKTSSGVQERTGERERKSMVAPEANRARKFLRALGQNCLICLKKFLISLQNFLFGCYSSA